MRIEIARPLVLLIIPLIIALLCFSLRYMYVKSKAVKLKQLLLRAIVAIALVLALSGMSIKLTENKITTIFVVDASDSVREQREKTVDFINEAVKNKGKSDYVGIVAFGEKAAVEQFVSKEVIFNELQAQVDAAATDIETAVELALSLMPADSAKRIVLVSDGEENEGSLKNTIASVISNGCEVKLLELTSNAATEVYVSDVKIPDKVGTGEYFNITVEIESNVQTAARVSLYSGRTLKGQQNVKIQKGTNTFIFRDTQSEEGLKTYKVQIEAQNDTLSVNNSFSAYTNISVKKPLLIIEGSDGEASQYVKIYDSIGVSYSLISPKIAPSAISDMLKYSAIILVNVYADDLKEGFLDNLEMYVKDYGGGFAVCGGKNSYMLGNYKDTAIETVLPVKMDLQGENEIPTMALQLVIDKSGSMSSGNGINTNLDLAKQAAVAAVENIRDTDYIGIMSFDDTYDRVVKLQTASDKEAIKNAIYSIAIRGGTSIHPALLAAVQDMVNNPAKIKHIILLTDGQDSYSSYDELINVINAAGITLSTVAVGDGCNETLLRGLAEKCNGRVYFTDLNSDIPRIFAQEVYLSANEFLVNESFVPIVTADDDIIKQVAADGLPILKGYVATTKKDRAIELLMSQREDPILCYWQYGLGKTVAWTSDVSGNWSGEWSGFDKNALLWHNIVQFITEENGILGAYAEIEQNGSRAEIKYYTEEFGAQTKVEAVITDDSGNTNTVELNPTAPGEYSAGFEMSTEGVYSINVKQSEKDEIISGINTAAIMQYSSEYRFSNTGTLLTEYAGAVGGRIIEEPTEVFDSKLELVKGMKDISTALLVFAAVMFMLDIAYRRFHFRLFAWIPIDKIKARFNKARTNSKKANPMLDTSATATQINPTADTDKEPKEQTEQKKKSKAEKVSSKKTDSEKEKKQEERLDTSQLLRRMNDHK